MPFPFSLWQSPHTRTHPRTFGCSARDEKEGPLPSIFPVFARSKGVERGEDYSISPTIPWLSLDEVAAAVAVAVAGAVVVVVAAVAVAVVVVVVAVVAALAVLASVCKVNDIPPPPRCI